MKRTYYVAIVPADLCSAGIEYKDFQSDYFLFDIALYQLHC